MSGIVGLEENPSPTDQGHVGSNRTECTYFNTRFSLCYNPDHHQWVMVHFISSTRFF